MKKIKVMTFCTWTSIGSVLQAWGVKIALKTLGCESTVLLPSDEKFFHYTKVKSLKSLLSRAFQHIIYRQCKKAYRKRQDFIVQNLNVTEYGSYDELERMANEDTNAYYLAGSDQIWHPDVCQKHFFLEFVRNGKCFSYAASMGKTDIPAENFDKFRELMQRLDRISVREAQCKDVLQQFTNKDIEVHIDPTFLIDTDTWRGLEREYSVRGPYILLYMIYWNSACKEQIKELKKRTGLPVYAICSGLSRVYADKKIFDVGVEEFLWLVDHAEYVITSSFHGVALSVAFNKKFAAVINPSSPSRIRNLLDTLSIPDISIQELDSTNRFDYDKIRAKISEERIRGMEYLKEVVSE